MDEKATKGAGISLHPLTMENALKAFMKVDPAGYDKQRTMERLLKLFREVVREVASQPDFVDSFPHLTIVGPSERAQDLSWHFGLAQVEGDIAISQTLKTDAAIKMQMRERVERLLAEHIRKK